MANTLDLKNYELPEPQDISDCIQWYQQNYGLNLYLLAITTRELELLVKFKRYGASATIMDYLYKLQQEP